MSTIKLHQQGDALSLTIPPEVVERLHLHAGQELTLTDHRGSFEVSTHEEEHALQIRIARQVLSEQHDALELLANR